MSAPATVDEYLASFPDEVRVLLEDARQAILAAVPDAAQSISYGIIRFEIAGRHAIYLGGWKKHLGIYPIKVFDEDLEREVEPFRATKDSVHFPYSKPNPYELLQRITTAMAGR